jgi:RNA polymerase sigma-70 factor (ECF subfamily)
MRAQHSSSDRGPPSAAGTPAPQRDAPSEADLRKFVQRAQQGDVEAFGMIYRHHQADILRYLFRRIGDHDAAQDLTQQVFLKAWQAIPRYRDRGHPLLAWLYTIARHQVIDHARASKLVGSLDGIEVGEPSRVEEQVLRAEQQRQLRAALERLSEDHREVLILRFWLDKPAAEVGELMDRSAGAVRVLQLRAIRALRRELEAQGVTS